MTIKYRFYESDKDQHLQYAFWNEQTSKLPYAWKPTKSPILFREQTYFHPQSRSFAFDGDELVGYISFSGSGDFVSLGYPWVKEGYQEIRDTLFDKVFGFASSKAYGGKVFAQRFREQWVDQIDYFQSKGFEITNASPILGKHLTGEQTTFNVPFKGEWNIMEGFDFDQWKSVIEKNGECSLQDLLMLEEYYRSVDFDFSLVGEVSGEIVAVIGVTLRKDTHYAEVLAVSILEDYIKNFKEMFHHIENEVTKRKGRLISIYESDVPPSCKSILGLTELTKDVMMFKR